MPKVKILRMPRPRKTTTGRLNPGTRYTGPHGSRGRGPRQGQLDFDAQVGTFTTGLLMGMISRATATVTAVDDQGVDGTLTLANIGGTFQDNEPIFQDGFESNMLADPGFEDYTGDQDNDNGFFNVWSAVGTADNIVDPTATVHGGSNAVKFIKANPDYPQYACDIYGDAEVVLARVHELKYWTRGDGANGQISAYVRNGGDIFPVTPSGVTGVDWTEVVKYFYNPTRSGGAYMYFLNEVMFSTAYVDDVSLRALTNSAFADGIVY